jgi:nucleolar protein 9
MTQLIVDLSKVRGEHIPRPLPTTDSPVIQQELLNHIPNLLISPFASPPLRTLLILLSAGRAVPSTKGSSQDDKRIRSKKSAKFRVNQAGQMQSIVRNENEDPLLVGQGKKSERIVPAELQDVRRQILQHLLKRLSPVEWRAMGVENVGSPTIQVRVRCSSHMRVFLIERIAFPRFCWSASTMKATQIRPAAFWTT